MTIYDAPPLCQYAHDKPDRCRAVATYRISFFGRGYHGGMYDFCESHTMEVWMRERKVLDVQIDRIGEPPDRREFTASDGAAVRAVVYAEPAIAAVKARLDTLGPATPNDITDRNTEIHRLERELRALLIPAYRRALIAAGWIEDEEGR